MSGPFVTVPRNDHADRRLPNNWWGAPAPNWMVRRDRQSSTLFRTFTTHSVRDGVGTDRLI